MQTGKFCYVENNPSFVRISLEFTITKILNVIDIHLNLMPTKEKN